MIKRIFRFYFLLLLPFMANAQERDTSIKNIRLKFKEIQSIIPYCDTIKMDIWDQSTQGGEAIAYLKDEKVYLIEKWLLGESYRQNIKYYFDKGTLLFVLETLYTYNRPYYYDQKMMKENNDTTYYDDKKTVITESRFYFKDRKLIRLLDGSKQLEPGTLFYINKEKELVAEADRLKKIVLK
jgi:hypothetical protein